MAEQRTNTHLQEMPTRADTTNWAMYLVWHWPGGEPLDTADERRIIDSYTVSTDTGVMSASVEADPYIPFARVALDVEITKSDVTDLYDDEPNETSEEQYTKEAVLTKAIIASIGALSLVGVSPDTIQLEAAYLVRVRDLVRDRRESDDPELAVTSCHYRVDELANFVLHDETENYTAIMTAFKPD